MVPTTAQMDSHPEMVVHLGEVKMLWPSELQAIKWCSGPSQKRAENVLGEGWNTPTPPESRARAVDAPTEDEGDEKGGGRRRKPQLL